MDDPIWPSIVKFFATVIVVSFYVLLGIDLALMLAFTR